MANLQLEALTQVLNQFSHLTLFQILYSADKGGDELNHIFLINKDGEITDLTPGENEKANFSGWSKDKKRNERCTYADKGL